MVKTKPLQYFWGGVKMTEVIDFCTIRYFRLATDQVIDNFVWFYNIERGFWDGEGEFYLDKDPSFKALFKEVKRREKCNAALTRTF